MKSMVRVPSPAAVLVLLAATSGVAACSAAADDVSVRSPSRAESARVTSTGLQGPLTNVSFFGDQLRGRVDGSPVNVRVDDLALRVTGILGEAPVDLQIRPTEQGLQVNGLLGGALSNFEVGPTALQGRIGRCSYDLRWTGDAYEGHRACSGRNIEPVSVQQPRTLVTLPPARFVALLTLMLGQ
jgi:hypothetical protein